VRSDIPDALLRRMPSLDQGPGRSVVLQIGDAELKNIAETESGSKEALLTAARILMTASVYTLRSALEMLSLFGRLKRPRDEAVQSALWALIADVGRRAIRSFHLEPLARRQARIVRGDPLEYETEGLNERIEELLSMVGSKNKSISPGDVAEKLESLLLFANLYPQPENATYLVHAISAGLGGRHDLGILLRRSEVMAVLATATRPFTLERNVYFPDVVIELEDAATRTFEELIAYLEEEGYDIPLPRGFKSVAPAMP